MNSEYERLCEEVREYLRFSGRPDRVFEVRPEKAALVIVDMQRFVCTPEGGRELTGLPAVIAHINLLADTCRKRRVPVIWLRHHFSRDETGDDTGLYPLFHKKPLSDGMFNRGAATEICEGMHLDPARDHVVFKNRYSAFAPGSSDLEPLLQTLGVRQLWICGVATPVCVECTARDAMQRDIETILISDATTCPFELIRKTTELTFRMFYGDVTETKDLLTLLSVQERNEAAKGAREQ